MNPNQQFTPRPALIPALLLVFRNLLLRCANPAHAGGRDDDQAIVKIRLRPAREQRQQQCRHPFRRRRMRLHPDHAKMLGQRQHHPITEVFIQCHQRSLLAHGAFENQRVIRPGLSRFRSAQHIVSVRLKKRGQIGPQHLVKIKPHGESSRLENGGLRVQDRLAGVIEHRLNIGARQFRVTMQNGLPRLAPGQLLQDDGHGNPRAFDDGLPAANARVDFNSLAHALNTTHHA